MCNGFLLTMSISNATFVFGLIYTNIEIYFVVIKYLFCSYIVGIVNSLFSF